MGMKRPILKASRWPSLDEKRLSAIMRTSWDQPHVVIDTPALRIVQFTNDSEREQITCDGDDGIMTVLDPGED